MRKYKAWAIYTKADGLLVKTIRWEKDQLREALRLHFWNPLPSRGYKPVQVTITIDRKNPKSRAAKKSTEGR